MQHVRLYILIFFILGACAGKKEPGSDFSFEEAKPSTTSTSTKASEYIDLENKGVGAITSVTLDQQINQDMASVGAAIYEEKCTLCHKPTEAFIGPAPVGILKRRSPEWVMNMILNPGKMVKEDSLAQALYMEFNGSPMANQGLTEEDARAVLEYFRTLE